MRIVMASFNAAIGQMT